MFLVTKPLPEKKFGSHGVPQKNQRERKYSCVWFSQTIAIRLIFLWLLITDPLPHLKKIINK